MAAKNPFECPKCGVRGVRRRGVGFEHEWRCADCSFCWDPDERRPMADALKAVNDVLAERSRQQQKGYTAEHDDKHADGSIAAAAALIAGGYPRRAAMPGWPTKLAKQVATSMDRRQQLVIAAAMIVAEIERLDRAALKLKPVPAKPATSVSRSE